METKEKVIAIRRAFGISAEELANLAGVIRQTVYKWQSGDAQPLKRAMRRLEALHEAAIWWNKTGLEGNKILTHYKLKDGKNLIHYLKQPETDIHKILNIADELSSVPKEIATPAAKKCKAPVKYKPKHTYAGYYIIEAYPGEYAVKTKYRIQHIADCGSIAIVTQGCINRRVQDDAYEGCPACMHQKRRDGIIGTPVAFKDIPEDTGPSIPRRPFNPRAGDIFRTDMMR